MGSNLSELECVDVFGNLRDMFQKLRANFLNGGFCLNTKIVGSNIKGDKTRGFDIEAEEFVMKYLFENYPDSNVFSEECGYIENSSVPAHLFVLDPVDGSTNFANGLPFHSFALAVLDPGQPVSVEATRFGLIGNLSTGDMLWGYKGCGVWKNHIKLSSISSKEKVVPEKAILGVSLAEPASRDLKLLAKLFEKFGYFRMLGSACLEIALVAEGVMGAYCRLGRQGLTSENLLASGFLLSEAGGEMFSLFGEPLQDLGDWKKGFSFFASGSMGMTKELRALCRSV